MCRDEYEKWHLPMFDSNLALLIEEIEENSPNDTFLSLLPNYIRTLPCGVDFSLDKWDLIEWKRHKDSKTCFVYFDRISNFNLKNLIKLYTCNKRFSSFIEGTTAYTIGQDGLWVLDEVIKQKPIYRINNQDFLNAEKLLIENYDRNTAYRKSGFLKQFADWMASKLAIPLTYNTNIVSNYKYGRNASDEDKDNKLIPTECILEIVSHADQEGLNFPDQFYSQILVLCVAGGFRISEALTLPHNPIVKNPNFCLRYYPAKKGDLGIKPIPPSMEPSIREAIRKLQEWTNSGREIVRQLSKGQNFDWYSIYQDEEALRYFFEKYCHEKTSDPHNKLLNPNAGWFAKENRWIDIEAILEEHGSYRAAEKAIGISRSCLMYMHQDMQDAKQGRLPKNRSRRGKGRHEERTVWTTDTRFISYTSFHKHTDKCLQKKRKEVIADLLEEAQRLQLNGLIYKAPPYNEELEKKYSLGEHAVLVNYQRPDDEGDNIILRAEECLMVIPKYALSMTRSTKSNSYSLLSTKRFNEWLCGTARGRGKSGLEESVFTRLNIIDPRTNKPLKVTVHDFRHWLNTVLNEGGATQESIRLIFARKSQLTNATYDQTSAKTRIKRMRDDIRKGKVFGEVQDNFNTILAEFGRDEAQEYLNTKTARMTIMPHGGCTLNWLRPACERNMSCFTGEKPCQDLCIDLDDLEQVDSLNQVLKEHIAMLSVIPATSPQHAHVESVIKNIKEIISSNKEVKNGQ